MLGFFCVFFPQKDFNSSKEDCIISAPAPIEIMENNIIWVIRINLHTESSRY